MGIKTAALLSLLAAGDAGFVLRADAGVWSVEYTDVIMNTNPVFWAQRVQESDCDGELWLEPIDGGTEAFRYCRSKVICTNGAVPRLETRDAGNCWSPCPKCKPACEMRRWYVCDARKDGGT